jgi:protein TonB
MSVFKPVYVFSVAAHVALFGTVYALETPEYKNTESIGVMVSEKKKKKPDEEKPKPIEAPPEVLHQKTIFKAPKLEAAPPPEPAPTPQHAALNAAPDFGISMAGMAGPGGPGVGVGIPVGPGGGNSTPSKLTAAPAKEKSFGTVKEAIQGDSPCGEDLIKPKPQGFAQPQYTDEARSAEVEGRVKLKLTVDAQGNVTDVQVLAGLGHGLDESSIATAKRIKFNPGTACSKPVSAPFVITFRFALGE